MASCEAGPLGGFPLASSTDDGDELLGRTVSASMGRLSSVGTVLPVSRLAERSPYTLLEDMPAGRLYVLFSKAGLRAACVVTESGEFRGMISRAGLIERTRRMSQGLEEEIVLSEEEDELELSPGRVEVEDR